MAVPGWQQEPWGQGLGQVQGTSRFVTPNQGRAMQPSNVTPGYFPGAANPGAQAGNMLSYFGAGQGFTNSIQGAMNQMLGLNLANQAASVQNKASAAPALAAREAGKFQKAIAKIQAQNALAMERARQQGKLNTLGALGGGGYKDQGPARFTESIGSHLNRQPKQNARLMAVLGG